MFGLEIRTIWSVTQYKSSFGCLLHVSRITNVCCFLFAKRYLHFLLWLELSSIDIDICYRYISLNLTRGTSFCVVTNAGWSFSSTKGQWEVWQMLTRAEREQCHYCNGWCWYPAGSSVSLVCSCRHGWTTLHHLPQTSKIESLKIWTKNDHITSPWW